MMIPSDVKATLSFSDATPSMELPNTAVQNAPERKYFLRSRRTGNPPWFAAALTSCLGYNESAALQSPSAA